MLRDLPRRRAAGGARPNRCRGGRCRQAGSTLLRVEAASKRFGGLVAVNECRLRGQRRRNRRPDRPERRRQDHHVQPHHRRAARRRRHDRVPRPRHHRARAQRRIAGAGIARTFQHVKLRPNMTLLDNVLLGTYCAHARRLPRRRAAARPRRGAQRARRGAAPARSASGSATSRTSSPAICRSAASASSRSRARSPPIRCCSSSTSRPPACAARRSWRSPSCCARCARTA